MIPLRNAALVALMIVALAGCGGENEGKKGPGAAGGAAGDCAAPNRLVGETCREPGVQDDGCPAGTLGLEDGTCRPAGIPPEMCGEGFVHDGDVGCEPILPTEPCPPGRMAVPGDPACRPVMPCAPGTWGDIPVDVTTEHVDGSYVGGGSDGSAQKPWMTIGAGIAAAAPGAIVAIAAGSYAEDVLIEGKPVVLWGVCPDDVEIVGTEAALAAVVVRTQAAGTMLRGLAITGASIGVAISGSKEVLIDGVWVHDSADRGIRTEDFLGATSCTIQRSLVERNRLCGVTASGSEVSIEAAVVRGTLPDGQGKYGGGVQIVGSSAPLQSIIRGSLIAQNSNTGVLVVGSQVSVEATVVRGTIDEGGGGGGLYILAGPGGPSTATVDRSLVEQNQAVGVYVVGSEANIDATVVLANLPDARGELFGNGIVIQDLDGARSTALVRSSLVEQNQEGGVSIFGSESTIEATVVRGTLPDATGAFGHGIYVQDEGPGLRSSATVSGSLVEQSRSGGVQVGGSDATVESTIVRGTLPNGEGLYGRGTEIQDSPDSPSGATIQSSVIEQNYEVAVLVFGSDVTVETTAVRGTRPNALGIRGRGINLQPGNHTGAPATGTVRSSLVEQNYEFGVVAFSSDATVEGCLVRATLPNVDARFGDGITAFSDGGSTSLSIVGTRIEDSARAGVSSFGAFVSLGDTVVQCASFDLEGEPVGDAPFTLEDRGGNACGCPSADGTCLFETVGIEPPEPVTPIE